MGHVYLVARVENPVERVSMEYRFMIDTGASYMVLRAGIQGAKIEAHKHGEIHAG